MLGTAQRFWPRILRLASVFAGFVAVTLLCSLVAPNLASAHGAVAHAVAIQTSTNGFRAQSPKISKMHACRADESANPGISQGAGLTDLGTSMDCMHIGCYTSCCGAGCHSAMSAAAAVVISAPEGGAAARKISSNVLTASFVFDLDRPPKR